jgi:putative hemolysin
MPAPDTGAMTEPEILMRTGILATAPRFTAHFARGNDELLLTQRLRYRVFAEELGARIDDDGTRLDRDAFDIHCRHLYVRDNTTGEVVACTRILTDDRAEDAGGYYSSGEFELGALERLPGRSMEIGRTCVANGYRSGVVIAVLWGGIAEMIARERFDYLFGCASVGLEDGGANAHAILRALGRDCLSPPYHRVRPRRPLPAADGATATDARMPPLLKAYVNLGARACGEPYWDPDFNCADVFMLLNVMDLSPRYARRFFGRDRVHQAGTALA